MGGVHAFLVAMADTVPLIVTNKVLNAVEGTRKYALEGSVGGVTLVGRPKHAFSMTTVC